MAARAECPWSSISFTVNAVHEICLEMILAWVSPKHLARNVMSADFFLVPQMYAKFSAEIGV